MSLGIISLCFGIGFILPIAYPKQWKTSLWAGLAGNISVILGLVSVREELSSQSPLILLHISWPNILPDPQIRFAFEFALDGLSAFFVLVTAIFASMVTIYSFDALRAAHYQRYAPRIVAAFNLFVWATLMVPMAYDVFSLFLILEIMTLSFGYLTTYKYILYQDKGICTNNNNKCKKARLSPLVYLSFSHTSTVFLLLATLILAASVNDIGFKALQQKGILSTGKSHWVFAFTLIGLGIRAGLVPAHVWVPLVHPSSPTTTHAFSLGVAIKVTLYLMYRFFFQFLPVSAIWGWVVLIVAVATASVNVWYALISHDLKEALAYHSVENIGIISAGIGLAMICQKNYPDCAMVALIASLYHIVNHALFKGLLYMAVGAIDNLTHQTVEMQHLGGLINHYPFTSTMFIIGAWAISGFPPLNGFISEWLFIEAFSWAPLHVNQEHLSFYVVLVLISLGILIIAFSLTAFCFYKMIGITLLGQPRLPAEKREHWELVDVPWKMRGIMLVMMMLCLSIGLSPKPLVPYLSEVSLSLFPAYTNLNANNTILIEMQTIAKINIFMIIVALMIILILMVHHWRVRYVSTAWNCGTPVDKYFPIQFTSGGTSFLLRRLTSSTQQHAKTMRGPLPDRLILSESNSNPQVIIDHFRRVYNYLIDRLLVFSSWFGERVQNKDIRRYLLYIFIANTIMLLYMLVTGND